MAEKENTNPPRKKMGRPRMVKVTQTGVTTGNENVSNNENVEEYYSDIGDGVTPINSNSSQPTNQEGISNAESRPMTEATTETTSVNPVSSGPEAGASESAPPQEEVSSKPFTDPMLEQSVDTKAYAQGLGSKNIPQGDIPEATFVTPTNIVDDSPKKEQPQIPQSEKIKPLNAEVNVMSETEKKAGAELTVAAFWSGYEKVNHFMGMLLQITKEKRIQMHNEDVLDLNMKVKVAIDGTMVTVNEFYEQYNVDVKEVFTVDPELKSRLTEPMKREAMRLGLIMSDKQVILLGLGEDIFTKAVQCVSIKRAMSNFTKAMKEQYAEMKKDRKEESVRIEKENNKIDPESPEGQEKFYEFYKKIKQMEADEVQKAAATSDLFKHPEEEVNATETVSHSKNGKDNTEEIVAYEEVSNSGNPDANQEL